MQSLKDIQSKRLSALKADGNERTITGSFSVTSNIIGTLSVGHKIEVGDRVSFVVNTVATLTESGLDGVTDASNLEAGTGALKILKTSSSFGTVGALQAAFTNGTLISFQGGLLDGATALVKSSPLNGNVTAVDGAVIGLGTHWLLFFNTTTTTGFPSLSTYPTFDAISPEEDIYIGVTGSTNYTDLPVTNTTSTTITVEGVVEDASFSDIDVKKHSRVSNPLIAEEIEAQSIKIQGVELDSPLSFPYSGSINQFKLLWRGEDNLGDPIINDEPDLPQIEPTDPFNIGVDIDLIQLLNHPTDKSIGVMLYQDLSNSNFYVKCFKYTYEGGFINTYTPYLISGADSSDILIEFSVFNTRGTSEITDPLLLILGGKDTPGTAIYAGVVSINTTTLDISDSGYFAWGDTSTTTAINNFTGLIKAVDFQSVQEIVPNPTRRWTVLYNSTNLLYLLFDTDNQTFTALGDTDDIDLVSTDYDYLGNSSTTVNVIKQNELETAGDSPYTIPTNTYATFRLSTIGSNYASLILFKALSYEGMGAEILTFNTGVDPLTLERENSGFLVIPAQSDGNRNKCRPFEIGKDKLLLFKSFGYYFLFNRFTGSPIYLGRSFPVDTINRSEKRIISINDSTVLFWNSSDTIWEATKFLTEGPYLAYKKNGAGNALIANNLTKIQTDFNLVKGATYYLSYEVNSLGIIQVISNTPGFAAKKLGVALDTNIFYVDMKLNT